MNTPPLAAKTHLSADGHCDCGILYCDFRSGRLCDHEQFWRDQEECLRQLFDLSGGDVQQLCFIWPCPHDFRMQKCRKKGAVGPAAGRDMREFAAAFPTVLSWGVVLVKSVQTDEMVKNKVQRQRKAGFIRDRYRFHKSPDRCPIQCLVSYRSQSVKKSTVKHTVTNKCLTV